MGWVRVSFIGLGPLIEEIFVVCLPLKIVVLTEAVTLNVIASVN
jgi:hypothetical protein